MQPTANWGTLYRLLMSQSRSEKNIEKVKSEFELCKSDDERNAVLARYQVSVKSTGQNKSMESTGDVKTLAPVPTLLPDEEDEVIHTRARDEDGKFKGDDPSTPEVNEAFNPPKPVKRGLFGGKIKSSGTKG